MLHLEEMRTTFAPIGQANQLSLEPSLSAAIECETFRVVVCPMDSYFIQNAIRSYAMELQRTTSSIAPYDRLVSFCLQILPLNALEWPKEETWSV